MLPRAAFRLAPFRTAPIGPLNEVLKTADQTFRSFGIGLRMLYEECDLLRRETGEIYRLNSGKEQGLPRINEALGQSESVDLQISMCHLITVVTSAPYGNRDLGLTWEGTKVLSRLLNCFNDGNGGGNAPSSAW